MHFSLVLSLLGLVMNSWSIAIPANVSHSNLSIPRTDAEDFLHGQHGHAFIEMTPENVEASDVKNWYANWKIVNANDSDFAKRGEINYFGMSFLHDEDYQCGLGFYGCNRWPWWDQLMKMYPNDIELARKVYFATKMHNIVNLVMRVIFVSTKYAL